MLMTQIFKPFQAFVQSFMGDYLGCLLETGELPNLGISDPNDECKFTFNKVAGSNTSSSRSSGSGSSSSDSSSSSSKSSSSSSSSSNSSYAGSNSRAGGSNSISNSRTPKKGVDGAGQNGKVVEIALEGGGAGSYFASKNGNSYEVVGRRVASVPLSGMIDADRKKLEKRGDSGAKSTLVPGEGLNTPPKKIAVKPQEKKTLVLSEDQPLTFGNFIRWLFIAALVIALVIFLGGQALQFSKSSEK
jgi:hypothetical protein